MISSRLNPWWKVFASHESPEGDRTVDLFSRPDGSYGFAEFSRDGGDTGPWSPVGGFGDLQFGNESSAVDAAKEKVAWLKDMLDAPAEVATPVADYQPAPSSTSSRASRRTRSR